jgi:predicted SAM-dependent methyltransferase
MSSKLILEIGPKEFLPNPLLSINDNIIDTVDIVDNNKTTYVCDLTKENNIPKMKYDAIYCLEVIEHCSNPNNLLNELSKLIKEVTNKVYTEMANK